MSRARRLPLRAPGRRDVAKMLTYDEAAFSRHSSALPWSCGSRRGMGTRFP